MSSGHLVDVAPHHYISMMHHPVTNSETHPIHLGSSERETPTIPLVMLVLLYTSAGKDLIAMIDPMAGDRSYS